MAEINLQATTNPYQSPPIVVLPMPPVYQTQDNQSTGVYPQPVTYVQNPDAIVPYRPAAVYQQFPLAQMIPTGPVPAQMPVAAGAIATAQPQSLVSGKLIFWAAVAFAVYYFVFRKH